MERNELNEMIKKARVSKMWLREVGTDKSYTPMELCVAINENEELASLEYELFNHIELVKVINEQITVLEKAKEAIWERDKHASDDNKEEAMPFIKFPTHKRFGETSNLMRDFSPDTNCEDDRQYFMWGSDMTLGYEVDLDYINRAVRAQASGKGYIVHETGSGREPDCYRIRVERMLDRERLKGFYDEWKQYKDKYPEQFIKDCDDYTSLGATWEYLCSVFEQNEEECMENESNT